MDEKTILVTGATGMIGSQIVKRLMERDNTFVIALSRSEDKLRELFSDYIISGRFGYIARDIGDPFDLGELASLCGRPSINGVFHAAGPISGATISSRPLEVIRPNLTAAQNILNGLVDQQKMNINGRMVVLSGGVVYGSRSDVSDYVVNEQDTAYAYPIDSQIAPYAETKRMLEVMARSYAAQYGIDAVIVRPSYLYGKAHFAPRTAIFDFIQKAKAGEDIVMNNSGLPKRDNLYIDDAVSGILAVYDKGISSEAYNISSGGDLGNFAAIDEIAEAIVSAANEQREEKLKVLYNSDKNKVRQAGAIFSNVKIKQLGWKVKTSLVDGTRKFLR